MADPDDLSHVVGPYRETPEQVQKAFGIRRSLMLLSDPRLFEPKWLAECIALGLPRFKLSDQAREKLGSRIVPPLTLLEKDWVDQC